MRNMQHRDNRTVAIRLEMHCKLAVEEHDRSHEIKPGYKTHESIMIELKYKCTIYFIHRINKMLVL